MADTLAAELGQKVVELFFIRLSDMGDDSVGAYERRCRPICIGELTLRITDPFASLAPHLMSRLF